ncbi:MAG: hypothetical protein WCG26_16290 [Chloroflexales bacterium]
MAYRNSMKRSGMRGNSRLSRPSRSGGSAGGSSGRGPSGRSGSGTLWLWLGSGGNIIGSLGITVAIFALPWLSFTQTFKTALDAALKAIRSLLPPAMIDEPNVVLFFTFLTGSLHDLSGWQLVTSVPTFTGAVQMIVYVPLALVFWSALAGLLGWVAKPVTLFFGLSEILLAISVMVVLMLFAGSLEIAGVNLPGFEAPLRGILSFAGVQIGAGYWLCFICAFLTMISGGMFILGAANAP